MTSLRDIAVADIGGTNARFAIARLEGDRVAELTDAATLKVAEHASLELAWGRFVAGLPRAPPREAALSIAAPVHAETIQLTNSPWVIRPARLREALALDTCVLVNDFGAVGHAVAALGPEHFRGICGPEGPLPAEGPISIVGPGTGLGVGLVVRQGGRTLVVETEGGHTDFAPLDAVEDALLARLRGRHRRVSVERVVSGPGLAELHATLAEIEGLAVEPRDDAALWGAALAGEDALAAAALERFCLSLGSAAGDLALAHGATAVVIAGGVGLRLADRLPRSGFGHRFAAKGRFEARLLGTPVKLITYPEPGLYGAAAAFAAGA